MKNCNSKIRLSKVILLIFVSLAILLSFRISLSNSQPLMGYEYIDNETLHLWNFYDDYYINMTSGIQITNHYEEWWTHNIFCAGYCQSSCTDLNNWNYECTDDLPIIMNSTTPHDPIIDDITVTGSRTTTILGRDLNISLTYYLEMYDKEITVTPKIENIGDLAIPESVRIGFVWRVNDIKIDNDYINDSIHVNSSVYNLNESLDLLFGNLPESYYKIKDFGFTKLRWNDALNYFLEVKSKPSQYNAPVSLGIYTNGLDIGQTKSTDFFWIDAGEECAEICAAEWEGCATGQCEEREYERCDGRSCEEDEEFHKCMHPEPLDCKEIEQICMCYQSLTASCDNISITSSGTTTLTEDILNCIAGQLAVAIFTDDVILDCNGYTLGGIGGENSDGVYIDWNVDNVTVKNCVIENFENGLESKNGTNIRVIDSNFSTFGVSGIQFFSVNNGEITNVRVTNSSSLGIWLRGYYGSSNINITGGSHYSSTYDYVFDNQVGDGNNIFRHTDWSSSRSIYWYDASDGFTYYNDSSGGVGLTTSSGTSSRSTARTIESWTSSNVSWHEDPNSAFTATYNLTGMNVSKNYDIYRAGVYNKTAASDASGNLDFTLALGTANQEINVIICTGDTTNPNASFGTNPIEGYNSTDGNITFELKCSDDAGVSTLKLYGNWSGSWSVEATNLSPINNTIWNWSETGIADGTYKWGVWCNDTSGNQDWTDANRTFTVITAVPPVPEEIEEFVIMSHIILLIFFLISWLITFVVGMKIDMNEYPFDKIILFGISAMFIFFIITFSTIEVSYVTGNNITNSTVIYSNSHFPVVGKLAVPFVGIFVVQIIILIWYLFMSGILEISKK